MLCTCVASLCITQLHLLHAHVGLAILWPDVQVGPVRNKYNESLLAVAERASQHRRYTVLVLLVYVDQC